MWQEAGHGARALRIPDLMIVTEFLDWDAPVAITEADAILTSVAAVFPVAAFHLGVDM